MWVGGGSASAPVQAQTSKGRYVSAADGRDSSCSNEVTGFLVILLTFDRVSIAASDRRLDEEL